MRIAKCLIVILALTTTIFGAGEEPSRTRDASCIVRITADPAIIPLNPQTVRHLILSSGVIGKTARDVLGFDTSETFLLHEGITLEWLAQSVGPGLMPGEPGQRERRRPRSTGQSRDEGHDEMMKQLAEIYGDRYVKQLSSKDSATEEDSKQTDTDGMMGGMGGNMGGMYGGMGGMSGGMMGSGMGGMMGSGGMYGVPLPGASAPGAQQSAMLRLSVRLPDEVKPVAEEFLAALVENLKEALQRGYEQHTMQLENLADFAESRRYDAERGLEMVMGIHSPDRIQIQEQLNTIVDLSMLTPEMPFSEAIETLKNAVEPPLPIVVLWKELLDSCEIEPTTPIDMDGLPHVKLETALRTLLAAVSGGLTDISYQIDHDVIIIREEESHTPKAVPVGPSVETDVRELAEQRHDVTRGIRSQEMDLAMTEARRHAIEEQIVEVTIRTSEKLEGDAVAQQLEEIVEMNATSLSLLQRQFEAGRLSESDMMKGRESLTKARIDLAMRREELAKSIGGNRLSQLNDELSQMAIDMAEKRAEMEFLRRQLAETEDEIARASMFDPQAARIRIARQALDITEAQVIQLKRRLAELQPPTVAVIGAN